MRASETHFNVHIMDLDKDEGIKELIGKLTIKYMGNSDSKCSMVVGQYQFIFLFLIHINLSIYVYVYIDTHTNIGSFRGSEEITA